MLVLDRDDRAGELGCWRHAAVGAAVYGEEVLHPILSITDVWQDSEGRRLRHR